MKKTRIVFWITTSLISLLMLFSSVSSLLDPQAAVQFFATLGYPAYMVNFLSVAKILGVIAILVPGFWRLKEWAYAGLAFDLAGALYSMMITMPDVGGALFLLVGLALLFASYFSHLRMLRYSADHASRSATLAV